MKGRKGFGTTDMLLALCVASLIAGGIFFYYRTGETTARAQELVRILSKAQKGIRMWHSTEGTAYAAAAGSVLWERGWFDKSVCIGDNCTELRNPWGGTITYAISDEGATFTLTATGIPDEACMTLARQTWDAAGVTLGNGAEHTSFPISASDILSECNSTGHMSSTFKLRSY